MLPSTYALSPSANGSAASFASHSPRLVSSLAAQTSGHESRIVWQTKLSMAGVDSAEKEWARKLGSSVRQARGSGAQHTPWVTAARGWGLCAAERRGRRTVDINFPNLLVVEAPLRREHSIGLVQRVARHLGVLVAVVVHALEDAASLHWIKAHEAIFRAEQAVSRDVR